MEYLGMKEIDTQLTSNNPTLDQNQKISMRTFASLAVKKNPMDKLKQLFFPKKPDNFNLLLYF